MQLSEIDRSETSRLALALLKAAKSLKITNHFALAERIGVDADSVKIVLTGGRPNTRTAERYDAFLAKVSHKTVVKIAEPTGYFLKRQTRLPGKGRRPEVLPTLAVRTGLGLHQQANALAEVISELSKQVLQASQLVNSLVQVAGAWDKDPLISRLCNEDVATRAALSQLLEALHPSRSALQPKSKVSHLPVPATKSRTLTRTKTRVK